MKIGHYHTELKEEIEKVELQKCLVLSGGSLPQGPKGYEIILISILVEEKKEMVGFGIAEQLPNRNGVSVLEQYALELEYWPLSFGQRDRYIELLEDQSVLPQISHKSFQECSLSR